MEGGYDPICGVCILSTQAFIPKVDDGCPGLRILQLYKNLTGMFSSVGRPTNFFGLIAAQSDPGTRPSAFFGPRVARMVAYIRMKESLPVRARTGHLEKIKVRHGARVHDYRVRRDPQVHCFVHIPYPMHRRFSVRQLSTPARTGEQ
jgi:hypothetical protein